jgi:hypothetical protein
MIVQATGVNRDDATLFQLSFSLGDRMSDMNFRRDGLELVLVKVIRLLE